MNHRVLAYDTVADTTEILLDMIDGIREPMGLWYDGDSDTLYIANAGNGEILVFSSPSTISDTLQIDFQVPTDIVGVDHIDISFLTGGSLVLTSPTVVGGMSFSGMTQDTDYLELTGSTISYYFADYSNFDSSTGPSVPGCSVGVRYYLDTEPREETTSCSGTNTGTITVRSGLNDQDLFAGTSYGIDISNIAGSFTDTGSYYVRVSLFDGLTEAYSFYDYYATKGDDDILTVSDNILQVFTGGLTYPTGIKVDAGNVFINDFLDRRQYELDMSGNVVATNVLSPFDFGSVSLNTVASTRLDTPVESLQVSYINQLLTVTLDYYKHFSCYDEGERIKRTLLMKQGY
ncbi:MAG: hypothetical protein H6767_04705 [Candidatus Peribacteria bacterium]|nr:MAG: hypothetical protein H6767_04705 [Candidatus Peribacteria bacterium]